MTDFVPPACVRPACDEDLPCLTEIYNHYILHTPATFDIEPFTLDQRREWFSHYATEGPYRVLVAEAGAEVAGYAWSSPFRPKRAYETSIETSVYCAPNQTGRGIGTILYSALFEAVAGLGLHRAYAGITLPNDASVALHERFGFSRVASLSEAGRKFGRFWDVAWYEKPLD